MKHVVGRWSAVAAIALVIAGCGGAEERKARYLENGGKFFAERNYEKARVEFSNALQIDPTDAEAHYQAGRVSEKLNNPRDAVGQYQAAVDSNTHHMNARAALARLYLLSGLPDKALELVEPGLKEQADNAQLLTARGAARAQKGNVPAAFEDAEAAIKKAPDDEYAIALLASLYRQNARSDKAIEVVRGGLEKLPQSVDLHVVLADLELAQDHKPEAEAQLKKVIELQPKELAHRYRLARFYVMTKDIPAAERTMRETIATVPDNIEAKVALTELLAAHEGVDKAEAELKNFAAKEKDSAAMRLALGRFYEAHDKPDQADATYRSIIKDLGTKPDGLIARNRVATQLLQKNQVEPAIELIDEVLKENPRDNEALILRGNIALSRNDATAAISDLRTVLRDQPNSPNIMRALARAHLQNNEVTIAEETLRSAAQANPTDRAVRLELAQLLAQNNRPDQARPILEKLLAETPKDAVVLESLFRSQAATKDYDAARVTAGSLQAARPDLSIGWYLEGVIDESEKKYDAAAAAYQKALDLQPSAGEPLTALVRTDLARKQNAQAMARLDKIIKEQPKNVIAINLKGELLMAQKDTEKSIATFNEAITIAPRWWVPYRGLALANLSVKRSDAAVDALEQGVKSADGAAALSTDLAALYERLGKADDAIRTYESLIKKDPSSLAAANNLAMLLVSYRNDQASLDRAQQLTAKLMNTNEPAILNTRGWVKFKRGEFRESLPLLQQAVDKSPDSPVMRYHLGMAQLRIGDRSAAKQNLEAAIAANRTFLGVKEAQAALDELKRAG
jgi:tetratricopeptide (TPR) repeat protein